MTDAYQSLDEASDELVAKLRPMYEKQLAIRERIVAGLASNGKQLRRNAICPCGSGKKFKKCCLVKIRTARTQPTESNESTDDNTPLSTTDD